MNDEIRALELAVYMGERRAGLLKQSAEGLLSFQYSAEYLAGKNAAPLSVRLPLQEAPFDDSTTLIFFVGLLPEDALRFRIARILGIAEDNPMALLRAIGAECAGAISIVPVKLIPHFKDEKDPVALNEQQLADIILHAREKPLLIGIKEQRLSLAGVQNKLALYINENSFFLSTYEYPSNTILKPEMGDFPGSVYNEYFCMQLAANIGLQVPKTKIHYFKKCRVLFISRYDRVDSEEKSLNHMGNKKMVRLHQEDFCQVLGLLPALKYEADGGPSLSDCMALITQYSQRAAYDINQWLTCVIFNFVIGNHDAHAKNFSFLYKNNEIQLAPFYDLLSTAVYKQLTPHMAMRIGQHDRPGKVTLADWQSLFSTGAGKKNIEKKLQTLPAEILKAAILLKKQLEHDGYRDPIIGRIVALIEGRVSYLGDYF